MGSRKDGTPTGSGAGSTRARARWGELNDRQRAYLEAVYRADQTAEAWERSAWSRGMERRPADEWRWILYGSPLVQSPLQLALATKDLVDKGTGSTFAALEGRGLLLTRHAMVRVVIGGRVGTVEVLYIRMSTPGRKVARTGLGEKAPEKLPAGGLREWHWRALAKAYAAGERGLEDGGGGAYARIGWRTWLRLVDYRSTAQGLGGLVEERRVRYAERSFVHRLFVTTDGRRFYREDWEEYRERYPDVEAPAPGEY